MFQKMQFFVRNAFSVFKNLAIFRRFRDSGGEMKGKVIRSYSNIIRRILIIFYSIQWSVLLYVSVDRYYANGDIGDNWTKLMLGFIGVLSVICGFYFGGKDVDKISDVQVLNELNAPPEEEPDEPDESEGGEKEDTDGKVD